MSKQSPAVLKKRRIFKLTDTPVADALISEVTKKLASGGYKTPFHSPRSALGRFLCGYVKDAVADDPTISTLKGVKLALTSVTLSSSNSMGSMVANKLQFTVRLTAKGFAGFTDLNFSVFCHYEST